MARLTQAQVRTIAASAGLPDPSLMAAIAMAESGGDTDAVGLVGEIGLWQINQPVHVKAHPAWTVGWLRNPANNAAAAKVILSSQGLGAWSVYTSGAYRKYLDTASTADKVGTAVGGALDIAGGPVGAAYDTVSGLLSVGDQVGRVAQAVAKTGNWVANPQNWLRVVYVGVGVGLVWSAVVMTNVNTARGLLGQAVGVAGAVAKSKAGSVARAAAKG